MKPVKKCKKQVNGVAGKQKGCLKIYTICMYNETQIRLTQKENQEQSAVGTI